VAIGDLNADGEPDLAVANYNAGTVSVLAGNGNGSFGAKSDYATGVNPTFVAIGDLDADGKPDLAVANETSNTVSVLPGHGDGTFGARRDYGTGVNPTCVVIGDVNGDGKPDLAVVNYHSMTVTVLLNVSHANTTGVEQTPPGHAGVFQLLAPRPNPSRGTSEIRFVLASSRSVRIDLCDVTGRRVWSWASGGELPAGPHAVTWNGRDRSGALARSGVYVLQTRAGRDVGVGKLVLQR
jgi:hypothetical protein